jgi:hypothetical protein
MRLYMWEQVTHLFAVIKRGIKHFRKELHQMVLALEFSARDWVEYDTSDYGKEDNYDAAIGGSAQASEDEGQGTRLETTTSLPSNSPRLIAAGLYRSSRLSMGTMTFV